MTRRAGALVSEVELERGDLPSVLHTQKTGLVEIVRHLRQRTMRIEPLKPPHLISLPGTPDEETLNAFTKTAAYVEQEALGQPLVVSTNDVAIPQTPVCNYS